MTAPTTILTTAPLTSLDDRACRVLIRRVIERAPDIEVLREKRSNVITARVAPESGGTVIVKTWRHRGVRAIARRLAGATGAQAEWRALERMQTADIPAARPLGFASGLGPASWQGIVMSDLGDWPRGSELLGSLLAQKRMDDADRFEDHAIDITQRMIAAGVVDGDHTFMNFIAVDHARPVRLDLELARTGRSGAKRLGEMIGRLIGSYYYLAHPWPQRVAAFAERLKTAVEPSAGALRHARRRVETMAERQRREHGIEVNLDISWQP